MKGLMVALGRAAKAPAEEGLRTSWPGTSTGREWRPFPDVRVSLFYPSNPQGGLAWSPGGRAGVLFDGYAVVDGVPPEDTAKRLAETAAEGGPGAAVEAIDAGSYNLVVLEREARRCTVATDALATIPLFRVTVDGGALLSTNPLALARNRLVCPTINRTACAMYAVLGHLVGERHFLEQIRVCRPATAFSWRSSRGELVERSTGRAPFGVRPEAEAADVAEIAHRFRASCERHARLELNVAQLQSAGMDSRLILSAWPSEEAPPCYSYGDGDSLEVSIARSIAVRAGAPFRYAQPHGDRIAEDLDAIFTATGLIVFPERFAAGRRMAQEGRTGVLDGLVGDVYLGGTYYSADEALGPGARLARFLLRYLDRPVREAGWDRITETLYRQTRRGRFEGLEHLVREDVAAQWRGACDDIKHAIFQEARRYADPDTSLAFLWRDYQMMTRGMHQIAHQGVVMRPFVEVCYPFVADRSFLDLVARIPAERAAHRRLYLRMYREEFPTFADLPYGDSMLPLHAAPFRHKVSSALLGRGIRIPGLTGQFDGKPRSGTANSWDGWLRESEALRTTLREWLAAGPLADMERADATLGRIAGGTEPGNGQLSHLAAISRWCEIG